MFTFIVYDVLFVTVSDFPILLSCSNSSGGLSYLNMTDCFCSLIKYLKQKQTQYNFLNMFIQFFVFIHTSLFHFQLDFYIPSSHP